MPKPLPTLDFEQGLLLAGHTHIAGLDEAGRGAWAGPVAAGAVILPLADPSLLKALEGVCDSKLCTPRQRDILYDIIRETAVSWAVSLISAPRIDEIGIAPATRQAMQEAIAQLDPAPDALLIDYIKLPAVQLEQRSIKKGDQKSLTIAAASILAKVARDRHMITLNKTHIGYGFARHKGYGTRQHQNALQELGPTEIHRRSFAPIAALMRAGDIDEIE
ncbi:MAG: ribonuclease HII [Anaerolineae bacterium]|nr:ribonuclease HII [Anaerolineae bacterium]